MIDKTIIIDFLNEILTNSPGIEGLAQDTAQSSILNRGDLIQIWHWPRLLLLPTVHVIFPEALLAAVPHPSVCKSF